MFSTKYFKKRREKREFVFCSFLDIDDVLNTRTTCERSPEGYKGIDEARVEILSKMLIN